MMNAPRFDDDDRVAGVDVVVVVEDIERGRSRE